MYCKFQQYHYNKVGGFLILSYDRYDFQSSCFNRPKGFIFHHKETVVGRVNLYFAPTFFPVTCIMPILQLLRIRRSTHSLLPQDTFQPNANHSDSPLSSESLNLFVTIPAFTKFNGSSSLPSLVSLRGNEVHVVCEIRQPLVISCRKSTSREAIGFIRESRILSHPVHVAIAARYSQLSTGWPATMQCHFRSYSLARYIN